MILTRILAACLLGVGLAGTAGAASPSTCEAPDDAAGAVTALPHVAAALQPGSTLHVLAVGSATIFGPQAAFAPGTLPSQGSTPPVKPIDGPASDLAFPQQMAKALEASVPGTKVEISVRGGRGGSAAEMLNLIRQALAEGTYQLVIWQTGTIEAVRNTPPGDFAETLVAGVEAVQTANADLVLIDPQFRRFLQTNSNLEPYEDAFQQVASMQGVLLFRRFDLMRGWANDGQIDLERTPKADRIRIVEQLHACLGAQLARMVLAGAHS